MSLVPDYEDSSEDSEEEEEEEEETRNPDQTQTDNTIKLPTPGFLNNDNNRENLLETSVFTNPFIEAENAKKAILEKHVKMVNFIDTAPTINGKRVCWNYRKGRCRFGHNCKYAHDSDLQKSKEMKQNQIRKTQNCQSGDSAQPILQELKDEKGESVVKKRKRPGLTQGLVPGKKVMKNYLKQKK